MPGFAVLPEGLVSDLLAHVGVDSVLRHSRCTAAASVDCRVARLMSLMSLQLEAEESSV